MAAEMKPKVMDEKQIHKKFKLMLQGTNLQNQSPQQKQNTTALRGFQSLDKDSKHKRKRDENRGLQKQQIAVKIRQENKRYELELKEAIEDMLDMHRNNFDYKYKESLTLGQKKAVHEMMPQLGHHVAKAYTTFFPKVEHNYTDRGRMSIEDIIGMCDESKGGKKRVYLKNLLMLSKIPSLKPQQSQI